MKKDVFSQAEQCFSEIDSSKKNLILSVKAFFEKKFKEEKTLEWMEISNYEDDPEYPDVLCKFKDFKDPYDIDNLPEELQAFVDYLNNDLAGILSGYDNILAFSAVKFKRKDMEINNESDIKVKKSNKK